MNSSIPLLDENLISRASLVATGANIHKVGGLIAGYRNEYVLGCDLGWTDERIKVFRGFEDKLRGFAYPLNA